VAFAPPAASFEGVAPAQAGAVAVKDRRCGQRLPATGMDARHGKDSPSVEAGLLNPDSPESACVDGAFWKILLEWPPPGCPRHPRRQGFGAAQDRKRQEP